MLVSNIIHDLQKNYIDHYSSAQVCCEADLLFNDKEIFFSDSVELKDGDVFSIHKIKWERSNDKWIKQHGRKTS